MFPVCFHLTEQIPEARIKYVHAGGTHICIWTETLWCFNPQTIINTKFRLNDKNSHHIYQAWSICKSNCGMVNTTDLQHISPVWRELGIKGLKSKLKSLHRDSEDLWARGMNLMDTSLHWLRWGPALSNTSQHWLRHSPKPSTSSYSMALCISLGDSDLPENL